MYSLQNKASQLVSNQNIAFISSIDEDGFPNTKAMLAPRKIDELKTFYFTTNTSSRRVSQFRKNPKACIYFCDATSFKGVMFIGSIEVLEDNESKEMIWREGDDFYYSQGVTDPDYCVLKFTATKGRYYYNLETQDFEV